MTLQVGKVGSGAVGPATPFSDAALSDLALAELARSVQRPTRRELLVKLRQLPASDYRGETAAESVRAERDAR